RRDGRELRVGVLVEPGVGGDDQIGLQRRDLIHLDAVGEAEHDGLCAAEFWLRPRPYAERLAAEPVGDSNRDDSDGQQVVLLGKAGADDALGRCRDFGLPEDVLDGDRAVLGYLARLWRATGGDQGRARSHREETPPGPRSRHPASLTGLPEIQTMTVVSSIRGTAPAAVRTEPRSSWLFAMPLNSTPMLSPAVASSIDLRKASMPSTLASRVPPICTVSPTRSVPLSTRPVATTPRLRITNTSSTVIRNMSAVSQTGV